MRIDRFVLDANIWVSYLITGTEQRLLDMIANNEISVFVCNETYQEIERVLAYAHLSKYKISISRALKFIKSVAVEIQLVYPIKNYIPSDENDNYVIALALQSTAGFVVSGDNHILSEKNNLEKKFKKLFILTKSEFEQMFN